VDVQSRSAQATEQSLDRRDFIGLFVAVEVRQHQSRVRSEGTEDVRSAAVEKVVEASPQSLPIDRHMTLTFAVRRVVQHGGMKAAHNFDQGGIEYAGAFRHFTPNASHNRARWTSMKLWIVR